MEAMPIVGIITYYRRKRIVGLCSYRMTHQVLEPRMAHHVGKRRMLAKSIFTNGLRTFRAPFPHDKIQKHILNKADFLFFCHRPKVGQESLGFILFFSKIQPTYSIMEFIFKDVIIRTISVSIPHMVQYAIKCRNSHKFTYLSFRKNLVYVPLCHPRWHDNTSTSRHL